VALNGALLFVVLFFVFPLKFLIGATVDWFLWGKRTIRLPDGTVERIIRPENFPAMIAVYTVGFAAVFALFALLYAHAYRRRHELELNELERLDTLQSFQTFRLAAGLSLLFPAYAFFARSVEGKPYENQAVLAATGVLAAAVFLTTRLRLKRRRRRKELVERMAALVAEDAAEDAAG
jgi:ABC-type xylose transport system permease subunit